MNVALTLNKMNQAMLIYDQPLGFVPAWVECAAHGVGIRFISDEGHEIKAGVLDKEITNRLNNVHNILLVRMNEQKPVEGHEVPFINQSYSE